MLSAFLGLSVWKTSVFILKPCKEIGQSLKESIQEGKIVRNLEIL